MTATIIVTGILALAAVLWAVWRLRRSARRARLMVLPLSPEARRFLESEFEIYGRLPEEVRRRLEGLIQVFLDEKQFEPCGGLDEVTGEMKLLVAAQACLLLAGLEHHGHFGRLRSILLYPRAYRDRGRRRFGVDEFFGDGQGDIRYGESWDSGSVVLSWQSVRAGAARADDGMNVVYHEFAHQLDQVDGHADGAPRLPHHRGYAQWARVFQAEYEALVEAADDPAADPLLDPYGANDPAEFFAVATETFFEMPLDLRAEHPELYGQLAGFYGLDPAAWETGAGG